MRILVTGGAGFLGSSLVDRLIANGHTVDVIDDLSSGSLRNLAVSRAQRSGTLKIHQCDIRDPGLDGLIARRAPEVVYHLATATNRGRTGSSLADVTSVDLVGTMQVLEAARAALTRKIVVAVRARSRTSTGLVGVAERTLPEMVLASREASDFEATVLELSSVYGPRQRPGTNSSVVATFVDRLRRGVPCVLHGTGEQTRDFLYVDDAADALARAADAGDGLTLEVGTGRQTSIADVYRILAAAIDSAEEPVPGAARPDDPLSVEVDPARARMYLGWEAYTPLAEGLTESVLAAEHG